MQSISPDSLHISKSMIEIFYRKWNSGLFPHQRLGQAFFNHFNLHKTDCADAIKLYELDGDTARIAIESLTDYNN